jgi:hypothetical protein
MKSPVIIHWGDNYQYEYLREYSTKLKYLSRRTVSIETGEVIRCEKETNTLVTMSFLCVDVFVSVDLTKLKTRVNYCCQLYEFCLKKKYLLFLSI